MKVLIVRNSDTAPEGAFGEWLRAQGHELSVVTGPGLTADAMRDAGLVVLLGSPHGVYQTDIAWIAAQRALVAERLAVQGPIIGICFGAQMLAVAGGGQVAPMPDGGFFRGWLGIAETQDPALAGPWPRWHGDAIAPPPGAEVLARDAGTIQAFALPKAIGVQFHPEATPALLADWARLSPAGSVDPAALAADGARLYAAREAARDALFTLLLRRALNRVAA